MAVICYEDLTKRSVSIITLGLLFSLSVTHHLIYPTSNDWVGLLLNLLFIVLLTGSIAIYITIRFRNPKMLFAHYLGIGDVLFWLSITPIFGISRFILIFTLSLIFSLVCHTIFRSFKIYAHHTSIVPLAGFQGLFIGLILLFELINIRLHVPIS